MSQQQGDDMLTVDDKYKKFVSATAGASQREVRLRYRDYCKALLEKAGHQAYQTYLEFMKS